MVYHRAILAIETIAQAIKWLALWVVAFCVSFSSGVDCLPLGVALSICIVLCLGKFLAQT